MALGSINKELQTKISFQLFLFFKNFNKAGFNTKRMSLLEKKKKNYNSALALLQSFAKRGKKPTVASVSSLISYREKKLEDMKQSWRDAGRAYNKGMKLTNKAVPLANEVKTLRTAKAHLQSWKKLKRLHNSLIDHRVERLRRAWQTSSSSKERKQIEFRAKELKERKIR